MSNKRFILPGQRCGNGLRMSVQGQSIGTDRQSKQSPLWVNAASGWQLKDIQPAQEVNTARVRRSGVRVTSPALLFSFRQWNKPVPMPEANHATLGKKMPVLWFSVVFLKLTLVTLQMKCCRARVVHIYINVYIAIQLL